MDCTNHDKFPDCPYMGFRYDQLNWYKPGDGPLKIKTCNSTPCNYKLEKKQEEIIELLKEALTNHNKTGD